MIQYSAPPMHLDHCHLYLIGTAAQDLPRGSKVTWDYSVLRRVIRLYDPQHDSRSPWRMTEAAHEGDSVGLSLDLKGQGVVLSTDCKCSSDEAPLEKSPREQGPKQND